MTRDPREIARRIRLLMIEYLEGCRIVTEGDPILSGMNDALNIAISEASLPDDPNSEGERGFTKPLTAILAAEMPRWVPVEEQPKKDGAYEVVDADGVRTIQWFDKDSDEWTNERDASYLTHWLDGVPSPPKERA